MTTVLSALLSALLGAFGDAITGWLKEKRAEDALRDAGAQQAINDSTAAIGEIADAQAKNNAVPRDVTVIAGRLQRGEF